MRKTLATTIVIVLLALLGALAPLSDVHAAPCVVPDNGGGTVNLPPAGCDYLSPSDVHEIINGLPPGTTIQLGAIHRDFICSGDPTGQSICSFVPPPGLCDQPGGSLGGNEECSHSQLQMTLQGTGVLAGWNRTLSVPVEFETHVGPRTPGQPVQSFQSQMFKLQGQLPAGDPDFDLLRITAGSGFGMPSPGHTTLTQLPGGNWNVDSFFDITYRIDFIGHPGGHVGGMSGSTTATIRMATGNPAIPCNPPDCNDNNPCTNDACDPSTGTCSHRPVNCDDGQICTDDTCDPATGQCLHTPVNCDDLNACTNDSCIQALVFTPPCTVPDNGGGTVTLPPAGCDYLSPSDVHEIINGLPPGTTIELGAIHRDFICGGTAGTPGVCSFPPPIPGVDCDQPGGSLGGEEECSDSTLSLALRGTGTLTGFNRTIQLPISFETHTAPRTPGAPFQSFATDMFRLFGQITNPGSGDPDFDLLRISAGTDFGMPSPGHTTLRQLPSGNWAVDSFFDITYRIDFVGRPGGALSGMSGSTTGTIRMQTGAGVGCVHSPISCDDQNPCTTDACDPANGQCTHTPIDCDDSSACTNDFCDPATGLCKHTPVSCDDGDPCTIDSCVQAFAANPCEAVPVGGTVVLPPAGCQYLSPADVHKITNGLPPGTHIELGAIHRDFICAPAIQNPVCSFPLGVDCKQGSPQAGEQECANSTLQLSLHGVGVAIPDRIINLPIAFETHVGPRTPGAPVQSFPTDMFRLFGEITNPGSGDPDFDLLRIVAGTDFGLPSPGHTTLTLLGNGNYKVDSFFDITYRIDFVGRPGGPLGGMSGSTTGTIRMATGTGIGCTHSPVVCDDGNPCTDDACDPQTGNCVFTVDDTNTCSDGNACTAPDVCRNGQCVCDNVGPCPTGTVTSFTNATPVAIPTGPAVISSTITVGPGAEPFLNRVRLTTNILHSNNVDLDITLTSPAGTVVTISSDNAGTNDNVFNGTLWDDKADPGNQVPFAGNTFAASNIGTDTVFTNLVVKPTLSPEEALGAFYGENPNGIWTLRVSDDTAANGGTLTSWGLELTTYRAAPANTVTTVSNATPIAIADNATATSTVSVLGAGTQIGRVRLTTAIRHTFIGDLDITLTSPGGRIVTIVSDAGTTSSGNDNVFNGTLWDDKADPGNQVPFSADNFAASNLVTDTLTANLVVKPTLAPEEPLAAFLGDDPNGTWTLRIFDDAGGDTGSLQGWSLEITTTKCTAPCTVVCDDHNPCTDDTCDPQLGCIYTPNDANACNDGSVCTTNDHCSGGTCVGTPISCDDGDVCTDDTCDPITGCVHTGNNAPCDDGNACTTGDACGTPPAVLGQTFDGVTAPALPAGWTTAVTPATDAAWSTTTAFFVSAPNSATTDTPASVSNKTLDSPAFLYGSAIPLEFENRYNLESTFDGAVLEIKIGVGAFTDIVTAGGSFVSGGYNATISTAFGSPIAGRAAWSGASVGFVHTKVNLPAAALGQTVVLRWRVASDATVAVTAPNGQWVDNVQIAVTAHSCQPGGPTDCDDHNACTTDSCDPASGCVNTSGLPPSEVASLTWANKDDLTWSPAFGATTSDVVRGQIAFLPVGPGGGDETCLANDILGGLASDPTIPTPARGAWYLVRGGNACGPGPYGNGVLYPGAVLVPRVTGTCP